MTMGKFELFKSSMNIPKEIVPSMTVAVASDYISKTVTH
jgi:uncharacterized membrane protein